MDERRFRTFTAGACADSRGELLRLPACLASSHADRTEASYYKPGDEAIDAGSSCVAREEADGRMGARRGTGPATNRFLGNGDLKTQISAVDLPSGRTRQSCLASFE